MVQPFGNSIKRVQKALDLTTPAKIKKENEDARSEFSDEKIDIFSLKSCLKLAFQIY